MLNRKHLPGPTHSRLHLVDHQEHSVPACQLAQTLVEYVGRYDISALTLDRRDDNCRNFIRRDEVNERLLFEEAQALGRTRIRRRADGTSIAVGVRDVKHA